MKKKGVKDLDQELKKQMIEYRALNTATSFIERAKAEHDIWACIKKIHGHGVTRIVGERRDWFARNYGGAPQHYEARAAIFTAGEWAYILLTRWGAGTITFNHARTCLIKVKSIVAQHKVAPGKVMDSILEQYDGTTASLTRAEFKAPTVTAPLVISDTPLRSRAFQQVMAQSAKEYAVQVSEGYDVDPVQLARILREFESGVKRALKDMMQDLGTHKRQAKQDSISRIGAIRFGDACGVLNLRATFKQPLTMRKLSSHYKKMAAPLQQRVDQGQQQFEEQLVNVNTAYEILKKYVKQMELGNDVPKKNK